ncbi:MAG: hypothetical protein NTW50_00485 [Candidatus Berkelbacteria bacterium]|nr:hypothetical protein [Candidatus Berkelbacteria bacterium]
MIVLVVIILFAATFYGGMRYERFRADKSVKTVESDRLNLPTGAKVTAPARIEGSVTKIDDKSITIKGNDGKAVSYTFDTKVTVLAAGKIAKMEVIKVGDSVRLYTKSGADNSNIINRISDLSTK